MTKKILIVILTICLMALQGCNTPPPVPCFNKGEVGEIVAIKPEVHEACYKSCYQESKTTITVNVNNLPRGCVVNDQAIDLPVGTKVNFPLAKRVW